MFFLIKFFVFLAVTGCGVVALKTNRHKVAIISFAILMALFMFSC